MPTSAHITSLRDTSNTSAHLPSAIRDTCDIHTLRFLDSLEPQQPSLCYFHPFFTLEASSFDYSDKHGPQSSSKLEVWCSSCVCSCLILFSLHERTTLMALPFLLSWCRLFSLFELRLLSNPQARNENASRTTRLPGGKSFFQKPDAKPRAALGSIANTLVERNAAGKVSSVNTWFNCGSRKPLQIGGPCKIHFSLSPPCNLYISLLTTPILHSMLFP